MLVVDFQPGMMRGVSSSDRGRIFRSALACVTAAQIHSVPIILTTIGEKKNGDCFPLLVSSSVAKGKTPPTPIQRTVPGFDALEDAEVAEALSIHSKAGRTTVIVLGLWTSMCMCFTGQHALRDGWHVVGVMDACGDASLEAHTYGIARMQQAGVVPITWMALGSEWMHDWASATARDMSAKVFAMDPVMAWL
jgi:nicotinamidase-related amidase